MTMVHTTLFKLCLFLLALVLLTGCQSDHQDELNDIEKSVAEMIYNNQNHLSEDIESSLAYIDNHSDDIKDHDVVKKIYREVCFLQTVMKDTDQNLDNYLSKIKEYMQDVYLASQEDIDQVIDSGQENLKDFLQYFHQYKEDLLWRFFHSFQL